MTGFWVHELPSSSDDRDDIPLRPCADCGATADDTACADCGHCASCHCTCPASLASTTEMERAA